MIKYYFIIIVAHNANRGAFRQINSLFLSLTPGFHTTRVDGPSTRPVETRARQHGPCWRVMETDHPSTRAVNSGSGNRALLFRFLGAKTFSIVCSMRTNWFTGRNRVAEKKLFHLSRDISAMWADSGCSGARKTARQRPGSDVLRPCVVDWPSRQRGPTCPGQRPRRACTLVMG